MIYEYLLENLHSDYVSLDSPLKKYGNKDKALFYRIRPKRDIKIGNLGGLILNEVDFEPTKTYRHLKALKKNGAVEVDLRVLRKMFFESNHYIASIEEFDEIPNHSLLTNIVAGATLKELLQRLKKIFEDNIFEPERENFIRNMKISISAETNVYSPTQLKLSHLGFIMINAHSSNKKLKISFNNILIANFSDINNLI
jgi:DNA-binding transcriptional ArsR family regulator